jgi:hypothetical protein
MSGAIPKASKRMRLLTRWGMVPATILATAAPCTTHIDNVEHIHLVCSFNVISVGLIINRYSIFFVVSFSKDEQIPVNGPSNEKLANSMLQQRRGPFRRR